MTISLDDKLTETATKVVTTRNADGDVVYGSTSSSRCMYRDMSSLQHAAGADQVTIDGLLWFGATEDVSKGDIYYHPSEGYLRIHRVIKAKDLLRENIVRFIKCEVYKQRQIS